METRLLLIRHGASEHHERRIAGGPRGDSGLTPLGLSQAKRVAARLARTLEPRKTTVYSSPLTRATDTAAVIAHALSAPRVIERCGLCSYHYTDDEDGMPVDDLWARARHGSGMALFRPEREGGDTWGQLVMRAGEALHEIADKHHRESVVVVTHNETIQASLVVLGYLPFRSRLGVSLAPCSITEWMTADDTTAGGPPDWPFANWNLVRLNDTAHLEE